MFYSHVFFSFLGKMYEIRIAATILSVIYPCFLGKLVRKLIGDDDLEGQYGDIILGQGKTRLVPYVKTCVLPINVSNVHVVPQTNHHVRT